MQTFVPYEDHYDTAAILDNKRLFKQLVECKQILLALDDPSYGWQLHPAVRMWLGHDEALAEYTLILAEEWRRRGLFRPDPRPYNETISEWILAHYHGQGDILPEWWGSPIHLTHQQKLLWKDPAWYEPRIGRQAPEEEPAYYWPV